MIDLKIVRADLSMLSDILETENISFTCPWSEKSFIDAFEAANITIYAAVDEKNHVLGFSCLLAIADEGEILNIAVHPSARKNGVGDSLMNAMLSDGVCCGVNYFYLEVRESNVAARHLYEKNGFVALGVRRRYYSKPTEDAVIMRKTVSEENV